MNDNVYQAVKRIFKETPFSYDIVYGVYLSNGDEELTKKILYTSLACNISPFTITKALYKPIDLSCFIRIPLYKRIFNFIIGLLK